MRRTVKAWTLRVNSGALVPVWIFRASRADVRRVRVAGETPVHCVVTYDDGRPAPRKRTTGKKGGR